MNYQAPKGVFDILPSSNFDTPSYQSSHLWNYVEQVCKEVAKAYNFKEIRTPIFEHTEVFTRSSGETSDIVSKEMYTFLDKGERSITLRPEGTASVTRAILENQLLRKKSIQRLFYIGPYFRYDRPQAGRYRQFHQFGTEVFGIKEPELDAEIISMLMSVFQRLGIKNLSVMINSIGDQESRNAYKTALTEFLKPFKDKLSKDSQTRLEKNPLRILDSKDKEDQKIVAMAPSLSAFLSPASKEYFERVCQLLTRMQIPYVINDQLVRGLDYYNEIVFEVVTHHLGAQNTIGAGGRYDGLLEKLGGQDIPSFGFAMGIERTILTMIEQGVAPESIEGPDFYFIPLCEKGKTVAIELANLLRKENRICDIHHKNFKIQKGLQNAFDEKSRYAVLIGDEEVQTNSVKLKNLQDKTEKTIAIDHFLQEAKAITTTKQ
jgi:histidyl-tRNA synthetase